MPTFRHGKSTVFKVDNAAGSLTDISNTLTDVSFPQSVDTAETSAFGSSAKSYVVGLSDGTLSVSGNYDATVDAQRVHPNFLREERRHRRCSYILC
jgi:hypothetical protein